MTTNKGMSGAIMAALERRGIDLELADKLGFGTRRDSRAGIDLLSIPFIKNGEVVRRKYRSMGGEPDGRRIMTQDAGGERILWNEDALRDDALLRDLDGAAVPLLITEGELDATIALQCGHARTVSVPDGAPNPPDPDKPIDITPIHERAKYAWFAAVQKLLAIERCPVIILGGDGDAPGAQLNEELSFLLGRFRCKYLVYPKCSPEGLKRPERRKDGVQRARCKDLNEVFEDWGKAGVDKTIRDAPWIYGDGVFKMSELPPMADPISFRCPLPGLEDHYTLRMSDWTVVTGIPSLGKSTLANDLYNRFADTYDLCCAWASFEQHPQVDHKRNLRNWFYNGREWSPALQQEADDWIDRHHRFLVPNEDDDVDLEWLFEKLEIAVVQHGCRIIIVDPWNELDHRRSPEQTMTEYVGESIKRMKRFARKFGVHFVVVAHPAKQQKDKDTGAYREPTLYDISDSANWYNKADLGLIVHRDADGSTLRVAKSRYHDKIGKPASINMLFDPNTRRFSTDGYRVAPMN